MKGEVGKSVRKINVKGIQTCEVIKESGREGCETVLIQGERGMMREGL